MAGGVVTGASAANSPAASFFVRAAQKLNMSTRRKKKREHHHHHHHASQPQPMFPTNFMDVLRYNTPPVPPALLRRLQGAIGGPQGVGAMQFSSSGGAAAGASKIKVMLRVCPTEGSTGSSSSFLKVDDRRRQVTVYDPSAGVTSLRRPMPPKMFAFDSICDQDDSMSELCSQSLVDIIQSVVNGADGCLFCYGHARLGKTYTMIGVDDCPQNLGVIPCAIAWLFRLIQEQKATTQARFSVRVSAVEVTGQQERLKDLLADDAAMANNNADGNSPAPGVYLRDDPICGMQLENQSELRAPTAERAAYYLDAAVAARTVPEVEDDARNSHMLFTLHIYQYRVDSSDPHQPTVGVAGGRSRLHLLDLGSCSKSSKDNTGGLGAGNSGALSLGALGTVILALLNGQRHVPHRHSKLTQLIRDSLASSPSCRTCMIAHVSPAPQAYNETLQVIQLAAKIHRSRPRHTGGTRAHSKFSSTSSDDSSCDEARLRRFRRGIRMGTLREGFLSDPSSSELSCDTVIYVGPHGQALSDRELTDNEGPPTRHHAAPKMGMMRSGHSSDESPKMSTTGSQTTDRRGRQSGQLVARHATCSPLARHTPPYAVAAHHSSGQQSHVTTPQLTPQASPQQLRHAPVGGSTSLPCTPTRQPRHSSSKTITTPQSLQSSPRHSPAVGVVASGSPQSQRSQTPTPQYRSSSASPHHRPSPLASPQTAHSASVPSSASSTPSRRIPQPLSQPQSPHSKSRHHHHHPAKQSPLARHSPRPSPSVSQTRQIPTLRQQQQQTPPEPPPRKLHVSKAAAAAVAAEIAAATEEGCEQWVDGPAAENWSQPQVKSFVRDWVEKHSAPEESSTQEETITELEEANFVEAVVERRPSERTLAWVKSLTTTIQEPAVAEEEAPPSYDICIQQQQQQQQQQPESIYELHMDETLETISGDKSFRNTFTSEEADEAAAVVALAVNKEETNESVAEGESEGEGEGEEEIEEPEEPAVVTVPEVEQKVIRRPTCLRRPDGASNPNLCAAAAQHEEQQEQQQPAIKRGVSVNDSDSGAEFRNVPAVAALAVKGDRPDVSSSGYESMLRGSGDTASCSSASSSAGSSDCGDKDKTKQQDMEPLLIQEYSVDDVERMGRRRREEEMRAACKRRLKVQELLCRQERLKSDLSHAKRLLMVSPSSWSFDLHVAEQMEQDNPHYLEALEKETQILEKRVEAAKSRIMLVTCFDSFNV